MIRLAIKNLWAHRRSNAWLFAELVIITIVAWVVVDPVVVAVYDWTRPIGYDRDRLVRFKITGQDERSREFRPEDEEPDAKLANFDQILRIVKDIPQIESAMTMLSFYGPELRGTNYTQIMGKDTIDMIQGDVPLFSNFFSTLGFETPEGMPGVEVLDTLVLGQGDYVITEDMAQRLFPGENPIGKRFRTIWSQDMENRVVGVVKNFRFKEYMNMTLWGLRRNDMTTAPYIYKYGQNYMILARVKDGVDPAYLCSDPELKSRIKSGNFYCSDIITLEDAASALNRQVGFTDSLLLSVAVMVFFLCSLLLGVIGVFWLQTRSRSGEAGILKSYGATKGFIVRNFLWESWLLTLAAWVVGCLIYLQYVMVEGFDNSSRNVFTEYATPIDWVSDFAAHFGIISAVLLGLLLIVVTIGVLVPAVRLAKINPVEALREE